MCVHVSFEMEALMSSIKKTKVRSFRLCGYFTAVVVADGRSFL